jgi:hypothetical protein
VGKQLGRHRGHAQPFKEGMTAGTLLSLNSSTRLDHTGHEAPFCTGPPLSAHRQQCGFLTRMATMTSGLTLHWLTQPNMVTPQITEHIARCWMDVSNAGGAVGFPFPPVAIDEVSSATEKMLASLEQPLNRLLIGTVGEDLAG